MCQVLVDIPDEVLYDTHMSTADAAAFVKQMHQIQDAFRKYEKRALPDFYIRQGCLCGFDRYAVKQSETSHRNLSPVHKMKGHRPVRPNYHLLNDGVPALRRECHLQLL